MNEYSPDYTAGETGMERFIVFGKKSNFIGRQVAETERAKGARRKPVVFEVDALDADVIAYEPVWINGAVRGFCTSGGYSHYAQKSIAMALVDTEYVNENLEAEIEILGDMCRARRITKTLFDPDGVRMRR